MTPSLEGVRAKIARANEHFQNLNLILNQHDSANPTKASFIPHESEEGVMAAVIQSVPQVPFKARIVIGEIVHALASAMDGLVFQLSLSHQIASGNMNAFADCDTGGTFFPIFLKDDRSSAKGIKDALRLMAPPPAALIRNMQPYQSGKDRNPLWVLRKLDIIDKHRVVLAVAHAIGPRDIFINATEKDAETVVGIDAPWQPLKEGAELFRVTVPSGYELAANFHANISRRILFAETGICDGDNVLWCLKHLIPWVEKNVIDMLAPYVT